MASLIALLSIIALPVQVAAGNGLTITTVSSSRASPEEITYSTTEDGFEVQGVIKRQFHNGRIRGHLDIAFVDANGEIVESGSSKPRRINYFNKHLHRVAFKALFDELPAGTTTHHIGTEGDQLDG